MPKNDTLTIVKRLQELDRLLATEGLRVAEFVRRQKALKKEVSEKTVLRDLNVLRELYREDLKRREAQKYAGFALCDMPDPIQKFDGSPDLIYWRGVQPLFTCNKRPRAGI